MYRFIIRRFLFGIVTMLGATVLVFALSRMTGDPRYLYAQPGGYGMSEETWAALGKELHLDRPLMVQYFLWLNDTLHGDLGKSLWDRKPVADHLKEKYPATLRLALAAFILSIAGGIPLGVLAAVKRGSIADYLGRGIALFGQAVPVFWLGIVGILVFSVKLHWLPAAGMGNGISIKHYIMPAVVLGILPMAGYCRLTRSAMLEIMDSEFIKFARSKGVREWAVVWKHGFRNALIAPLTFSALQVAGLVSGAVVTESVFAWPGVGRLAYSAVTQNDFPTLLAVVLSFCGAVVVMNFIADLAYGWVDPRIRYD